MPVVVMLTVPYDVGGENCYAITERHRNRRYVIVASQKLPLQTPYHCRRCLPGHWLQWNAMMPPRVTMNASIR